MTSFNTPNIFPKQHMLVDFDEFLKSQPEIAIGDEFQQFMDGLPDIGQVVDNTYNTLRQTANQVTNMGSNFIQGAAGGALGMAAGPFSGEFGQTALRNVENVGRGLQVPQAAAFETIADIHERGPEPFLTEPIWESPGVREAATGLTESPIGRQLRGLPAEGGEQMIGAGELFERLGWAEKGELRDPVTAVTESFNEGKYPTAKELAATAVDIVADPLNVTPLGAGKILDAAGDALRKGASTAGHTGKSLLEPTVRQMAEEGRVGPFQTSMGIMGPSGRMMPEPDPESASPHYVRMNERPRGERRPMLNEPEIIGTPDSRLHSKLEEVIQATFSESPEGIPANQLMNRLSDPAYGVDPAEIYGTTVDDWLKQQGDRPISLDEIQKVIDENRITVEVYQRPFLEPEQKSELSARSRQLKGEQEDIISEIAQRGLDQGHYRSAAHAREEVKRALLNQDFTNLPISLAGMVRRAIAKYHTLENAYSQTSDLSFSSVPIYNYMHRPIPGIDPDGSHEFVFRLPEKVTGGEKYLEVEDPGSKPHYYGAPNIVGWIRVHERTDASTGLRALVVHEIQSLWHQRGKAVGYRPITERGDDLQRRISELESQADVYNRNRQQDEYNRALDERDALRKRLETPVWSPFIAKWHVMMNKYIVHWAAENGYDFVAYVPGKHIAKHWEVPGLERLYDGVFLPAIRDAVKEIGGQRTHILVNDAGEASGKYPAIRITDELKQNKNRMTLLMPSHLGLGIGSAGVEYAQDIEGETPEQKRLRVGMGFARGVVGAEAWRRGIAPGLTTRPIEGFYSEIQRQVDVLFAKVPKMPAQTLLSKLRGGGVHKDELKWTGMELWLKERGSKPVTAKEVQKFLADNNLKVEERLLGPTEQGSTGDPTLYGEAGVTLSGGENYRELLLTVDSPQIQGNYVSEHWDTPNVFAHIRFADREIGGRKTLLIEEIQSDWHQAAQAHGYRDPNMNIEEIESRHDNAYRQLAAVSQEIHRTFGTWHASDLERMAGSDPIAAELLNRFNAAGDEYTKASRELEKAQLAPISGPFSEDWWKIAFKRAVFWAAKNGYDRVAITPGDIQVERGAGEGATKFYDESLVNYANKFLKQWGEHIRSGSVKKNVTLGDVVRRIDEELGDERAYPSLREIREFLADEGIEEEYIRKVVEDYRRGYEATGFPDIKYDEYDRIKVGETTVDVYQFAVTPEMRKQITEKGMRLILPPEVGGAVAGGVSGAAQGEEDDTLVERGAKILGGAALGGIGMAAIRRGSLPGSTIQPVPDTGPFVPKLSDKRVSGQLTELAHRLFDELPDKTPFVNPHTGPRIDLIRNRIVMTARGFPAHLGSESKQLLEKYVEEFRQFIKELPPSRRKIPEKERPYVEKVEELENEKILRDIERLETNHAWREKDNQYWQAQHEFLIELVTNRRHLQWLPKEINVWAEDEDIPHWLIEGQFTQMPYIHVTKTQAYMQVHGPLVPQQVAPGLTMEVHSLIKVTPDQMPPDVRAVFEKIIQMGRERNAANTANRKASKAYREAKEKLRDAKLLLSEFRKGRPLENANAASLLFGGPSFKSFSEMKSSAAAGAPRDPASVYLRMLKEQEASASEPDPETQRLIRVIEGGIRHAKSRRGGKPESTRPTRFYHGRSRDYNSLRNRMYRDGLYGPGLYLADNPEVANDYSAVERALEAPAQAERLNQVLTAMRRDIAQRGWDEREVRKAGQAYIDANMRGWNAEEWDELIAEYGQEMLSTGQRLIQAEQEHHRAIQDLQSLRPNVVPIEASKDLNFVDFESPDPDFVHEMLNVMDPQDVDEMLKQYPGLLSEYNYTAHDPKWVYGQLVLTINGGAPAVNKLMARAGYDGIYHDWGNSRVLIVFPESIEKLRYAYTGESVQVPPEIAGAIAGGASGAAQIEEDDTLTESGAKIVAGATVGGVGAAAIRRGSLPGSTIRGVSSDRHPRLDEAISQFNDVKRQMYSLREQILQDIKSPSIHKWHEDPRSVQVNELRRQLESMIDEIAAADAERIAQLPPLDAASLKEEVWRKLHGNTKRVVKGRWFHGTAQVFDKPTQFDETGLYGPGYYLSSNPKIASVYASYRHHGKRQGANVRAVTLDDDFILFDAAGVISKRELDHILTFVPPEVRQEFLKSVYSGSNNLYSPGDIDVNRGELGWNVHRGLARLLRDTRQELDLYGDPGAMNRVLKEAGYDGILHEDKDHHRHRALMVFPESLNKVTNVISGTKGGAFMPTVGGLGGATQGEEDDTLTERGAKIAAGAVLGYGVARGKFPGLTIQPADPTNKKHFEMYYGGKGIKPPNPERLESLRRWVVAKWFDRGVHLAEFQKAVIKNAGVTVTPELMAYELQRLDPNKAAEIVLQDYLKPALQLVGDDQPWLANYLTYMDNIDVARAMGRRAGDEVLDRGPRRSPITDDLRRARARVRAFEKEVSAAQATGNAAREREYTDKLQRAKQQVTSLERRIQRRESANYVRRFDEAVTRQEEVEQGRRFPGGFNVAESEQALEEMRQQLGPQKMQQIEEAANQVYQLVDWARQRMVDSGVWSQELVDQLKRDYPHYIPTRILDYMDESKVEHIPLGRSVGLNDHGLRRLTLQGTEQERLNPLVALVTMVHEVERRARKNEVFNAFVNLRALLPDPDTIMPQVPQDYKPKAGADKAVGFINGEKVAYDVPKELVEVLKIEPTKNVAVFSTLTAIFRALATARNPIFVVGQIPLDSFTYIVREAIREGGPQHTPGIIADLVRAYVDSFSGILRGEYTGTKTKELFRSGGGMFGFFPSHTTDSEKIVRELSRRNAIEIKNMQDAKDLLFNAITLRPVEYLGERIELAPRVAAMMRAQKRGKNKIEQTIAARDVTIDFNQGGAWAKTITQIIPFFNVGMQALAQIQRASNENPKGFFFTIATLMMGPVLMAEAWNNADEQRARDYEDVPDYIKDGGIVFMSPFEAPVDAQGNRRPQFYYLRLREFAPVAIVLREGIRSAMGKDVRSFSEIFLASVGSVSPVRGGSVEEITGGLLPIGVGTTLQLATNKDFFRGRHITSRSADERASAIGKAVAGSSIGQSIGARPSQVDFAIRDLGAGLGSLATDVSDTIAGEPPRTAGAQALPVVGRVAGRFVRGDVGGELERARSDRMSPRTTQILREVQMYDITPVDSEIQGIPLLRVEQGRLQQLTNQYIDESVQRIASSPAWSRLDEERKRELILRQMQAARRRAEIEVIRSIGSEELGRRLRGGANGIAR